MNILKLFQTCQKVSTDSRFVEPGSLFFGLKGPNFDGSRFAAEALNKGAKYAVVDRRLDYHDSRMIPVDDTLTALQQLAMDYRQSLRNLKLIAVAGSNGKTTTRELIFRVLKADYKVSATQGNLNNHIGLPLSVLAIDKTDEFAVIEMGASRPGEHALLCEISRPQYGILTNNGKDHLEGYGSEHAVIESNKEVYNYFERNNGLAFVNADDPVLIESSKTIKRVFYGSSVSTRRPENIASGRIISKFPTLTAAVETTQGAGFFEVKSRLFGSFQLYNILAAAAFGAHFKVAPDKIRQAVESYTPANNRSQFITWHGNRVLLDAYNANPTSMASMIRDFSECPAENKTLVLGDMRELGTASESEHMNIIRLLKKERFYENIFIGEEFGKCRGAVQGAWFASVAEAKKYITPAQFKNCFFLVKGSRAMALETIFM